MRYLIILKNGDCLERRYYDFETFYTDGIFMIIDLNTKLFSTNGISFKPIKSLYDVHR